VIYAVISASWKKKTEQAMLGNESDNGGKDKEIICHICDRKGHKEKKCWYYDANKSREENRKKAQEKIKLRRKLRALLPQPRIHLEATEEVYRTKEP
jgi:hypothetical protein